MHQLFAIFLGTLLMLFGCAGFIPTFVNQKILFNLFRINFEHNILHFAIGLIGVLCGMSDRIAARSYFFASYLFFGFLAMMGFVQRSDKLFFMFAVNKADHYLHLGISLVFLLCAIVHHRAHSGLGEG